MSITSKLNKVYAKVGMQITDPKRFWICYWCNLAITIFIQVAAKAYISKTTKDEETSRATDETQP